MAVASGACGCTGDRSDRITRTLTNLVAHQPTEDAADHRSGDPVLIFHRRLLLHLDIPALFTRRPDRFFDVLDGKHLGIGRRQHLVSNDPGGADGDD